METRLDYCWDARKWVARIVGEREVTYSWQGWNIVSFSFPKITILVLD